MFILHVMPFIRGSIDQELREGIGVLLLWSIAKADCGVLGGQVHGQTLSQPCKSAAPESR